MTAALPRRRVVLGALGAALGASLPGCGVIPTFHPEARAGTALPADHVLIVGRIDLVPPLRDDDQRIRTGGIDPLDTEGKLRHRAVFFLADAPATERRQTASVMNPRLGEWFVVAVPRTQRYVADAAVFMAYEPLLYGRRQATVQTSQLVLPALFGFDIRPQDRAVYIGSWRVWRDEFHQVTRLLVSNELPVARAELERRVGGAVALRAALPDLPQARVRTASL